MTAIISAITTPLIVGVMLALFNRRAKQKDEAIEHRAEMRKRESLLALNLAMANGKLSYAVAMAIKRGKPNGEIEEATKTYEKAKNEYYAFINGQFSEHMQEK